MNILELKHITYAYDRTPVLNDVSMTFEDGACYAIVGPSGADKTTLLSLMSGLTAIQDGDILYQRKSLRQMNMYDYRSHDAGIIFQHYNLLTKLTALENVELSMEISGMYRRGRRERARALLADMGLSDEEMNRRVLRLSGGQQQRVAIARSLSYDPSVILADEPTGNLDAHTRDEIMDIFLRLREAGRCIIIVTHSTEVSHQADHVYHLERMKRIKKDGRTPCAAIACCLIGIRSIFALLDKGSGAQGAQVGEDEGYGGIQRFDVGAFHAMGGVDAGTDERAADIVSSAQRSADIRAVHRVNVDGIGQLFLFGQRDERRGQRVVIRPAAVLGADADIIFRACQIQADAAHIHRDHLFDVLRDEGCAMTDLLIAAEDHDHILPQRQRMRMQVSEHGKQAGYADLVIEEA